MKINSENDLKEFYTTHYELCVRQSYRITVDLQIAQDIVQDCMVKLWERRVELSQKDNLVFYFKRMVSNRSIDHLRRKIPLNDAYEMAEISNSDSNELEYNELANSIDKIIDGLPERCRQVFVLSRFENMTYKQIAKQLNISNKTVENQISKALKVLRSNLGDRFLTFFI